MRKVILMFALILVYSSAAHANLTDNLVARYLFNGDANDATANNNHGTVSGASIATDRFGNQNSAYYFDGINDEITVSDSFSLEITSSITISMWVKFDGSQSEVFSTLLSKIVPDSTRKGYGIYRHVYSLADWYVVNDITQSGGWTRAYSSFNSLSDGNWHHIVATYDGNNVTNTYIDGELDTVEYAEMSQTIGTNNEPLTIGYGNNALSGYSANYYKGSIDDIRIYGDRVLTDCEIKELYIAELKRKQQ